MHDEATFDQFAPGLLKELGDIGETGIEIPAPSLPNLAPSYFTQSIAVKKTYHYYEHYYRAESLEFFVSRTDCQRLALAMLAIVMRKADILVLHLKHPDSQIRSLRVPQPRSEVNRLGLQYVGTKYVYSPTNAMADLTSHARTGDKPVFKLCASTPHIEPRDWEKRDVVEVDASDVGLLFLIQMLLDLGCGPADRTELELSFSGGSESSVGPRSAEARFWLPGSIARPE
jgi:hypothetical protein